MALTSLALASVTRKSLWYYPVMLLGMVGAGLFFGDGVITPAISVLSAIEGVGVATPATRPYVIPLTLTVPVGIFRVLDSKLMQTKFFLNFPHQLLVRF